MDQCITNIREEIMKVVMNETTLKILNQIIDNNNNNMGNILVVVCNRTGIEDSKLTNFNFILSN